MRDEMMERAEKLYEYCEEKGMGIGIMKWFTVRHFYEALKMIKKEEKINTAFAGLNNFEPPIKSKGIYAFIVTGERIVYGQWNPFGKNIKILYLNKIRDIKYKQSLFLSEIVIDAMSEEIKVLFGRNTGENVLKAMQERGF